MTRLRETGVGYLFTGGFGETVESIASNWRILDCKTDEGAMLMMWRALQLRGE